MLEAGIKLRYVFNSRKSEEFTNQRAKQGIPNQRAQGRLGNGNAEAGNAQQQSLLLHRTDKRTLHTGCAICCNNLLAKSALVAQKPALVLNVQ